MGDDSKERGVGIATHVQNVGIRGVAVRCALQGEVPVGRCNHCCGALPGGRQMLVFGGWNTTFVDHCYLLNTDTWRWALKAVKDDKVSPSLPPRRR